MALGQGAKIGIGLGLGAIGTTVNMFRARKFLKEAQRDLKNLKANPASPFSVGPELRSYYNQSLNETRNPMGVSGAERNAFNQNIARQNNTVFNNAISMSGGSMATALRSSLNSAALNQVNNFAQFDAGQRRMNRQSAFNRLGISTNQMQRIRGQNEQYNIDAQAALGDAIRIQRENISKGWSSLGRTGNQYAGYQMGMYSPQPQYINQTGSYGMYGTNQAPPSEFNYQYTG
jgi:hypothetical protein